MQVLWNGQPRATQFVNDFLLKVTITQSDLAQPGLVQMTVIDTGSGQTISGPIPILIYLPIANNDLTYDSSRGKIYVSVSKQDDNGPALAIVNPDQGVVERYVPLPSEPGALALSAHANYLYIGMADRIRRMDLTGSTADVDIPASILIASQPSLPASIPFQATSLLALPNLETSFIVAAYFNGFYSGFVVDGTTLRPAHSNEPGRCLVGSPDGVTIYSGPGLLQSTLGDTGLPYAPNHEDDALAAGPACPVYANGLIYGSDGDVVDPVSHSRVRWIPALGNLDVVPANNQVYFLDRLGGSSTGTPTLRFEVFDGQSGSLLKSVPLGLQMSVANNGASNGHLIHWGSDGVAFGDYSTLNSTVAKWLYLMHVP